MDLELAMPYSTLRDRQKADGADNFQTPTIALRPLIPALKRLAAEPIIWEPAAGRGNLAIALEAEGLLVLASDILPRDPALPRLERDFLTWSPYSVGVNAIVTNPPFSLKDEFLARCYALSLPFALLMPLSALGGKRRQNLYRQHGVEVVMMGERIDFQTPSGKQGGAWFETCWITWGLGFGSAITFATLEDDSQGVLPMEVRSR